MLEALESKGGEVEPYRKDADAVSGITIDVFDTKSTWASIVGWLTSEEGGRRVGWNLLVGLATLVGFWLLSIVVGRVTDRLAEASEAMSQLLQEFLGKMVRRLVLLIGLVMKIMEIVAHHELTLDDPEPVIRLHELADSSVNFVCRPWVKTDDYWTVYWDVTRAVKEEFDRQGVSIPFPQRDVHLHGGAPAAT